MTVETQRKLKVSIKTFGCQMNVYDTEVAGGVLSHAGYEVIEDTNPIEPAADIVLMNTCSVREHAEDRVHGRLGMFGKYKKENPDLIVGLMGCMVEEHREKLFRRYPHLDLMVGTRNVQDLPHLIEEVRLERRQVSRIKQDGLSIEYTDQIRRNSPYHAWLPVMTGCNKVCTFCIVPITRGSEISMPARDVYREASRLVEDGVKWITLLGQNVNSYRGGEGESGETLFPELLDQLCSIEGLEAISFTTSHPHDATEELYRVIAKNPKISRRFHLPLQSGADTVLRRMKRLHTFEEFRSKIERMRALIPDVVVTTDIIAGFSGESEADHQATKHALEQLRFDGAFIYKYSVRPGTPAARLEDDVPLKVKERRNAELLDLQRVIESAKREGWIGETISVFAEEVNTRDDGTLIGRSRHDHKVVFSGGAQMIGDFWPVKLTALRHETFSGEVVESSPAGGV